MYLTAAEVPGGGVFNQACLGHNSNLLTWLSYDLLGTVALNECNSHFLHIKDHFRVVLHPMLTINSSPELLTESDKAEIHLIRSFARFNSIEVFRMKR